LYKKSFQIVKFAIVGFLNTSLGIVLYIFFVKQGVYYQYALIIDYVCGIMTGYFLNSYWTFAGAINSKFVFIKYVTVYLFLYFVNSLLLEFIVKHCFITPIYGQIIAFSVISIISFLFQRSWVFKLMVSKIHRS